MSSRRRGEPWYYGYLRDQITRIWGWSPERRKALNRARSPGPRAAGDLETWHCEECGDGPLERNQRDVDHRTPRESLTGFDGWGPYIERALDVKADALRVVCKKCHQKKSASENNQRRSAKKAKP